VKRVIIRERFSLYEWFVYGESEGKVQKNEEERSTVDSH